MTRRRRLACPSARFGGVVAALALSAAIGLTAPAHGLDPQRPLAELPIDRWGLREGLPQTSVTGVVQTADGYLWLGTLEGLVRFDGERFTVFDRRNTPGLDSPRMGPLAESAAGVLWAATETGTLLRWDPTARRLVVVAQIPLDGVTSLLEDGHGDLWLGGRTGLVRRQADGGVTTFHLAEGLPSEIIGALARAPDGTIWVATPRGVARCQAEPSPHCVGVPELFGADVLTVQATATGELLALTPHALLRLVGERFVPLAADLPFTPLPAAQILDDRDGGLWITAGLAGLGRLVDGVWSLTQPGDELAGLVVRALGQDREGSLWVGTEGGGLARLRDTDFATYGRREGLSDDFVWTVAAGRDGTLWAGTQGGALNRLTGDGAPRIAVFGRDHGLPGAPVRAILDSLDRGLLVGTAGAGVWRFDGRRATPLDATDTLATFAVRALLETRDGALWIAGEGALYRLADGRLSEESRAVASPATPPAASPTAPPRGLFLTLLEDRQGTLWAGTGGTSAADGLWALRDGAWRHYGAADGLPRAAVRSLFEDRDGDLWVGTEGGGLARRQGERFTVVSSREGLYDDLVSVILADDGGNFWLSSNRGISAVRRQQLVDLTAGRRQRVDGRVFDEDYGLVSRETNGSSQPAGVRTADGRLWFPTMAGVAVVDPRRLRPRLAPPLVAVERLLRDREEVAPSALARLPPGRTEIELQYAALTFLGTDRIRFRYRLLGYDGAWSAPVARRSAFYTNLPPGTYRFEVEASNRDGTWSEAPAAISFTLRPWLWQTAGFRIAAALAAGGLLVAVYRARVTQLTRRGRELERLVAERTRELATANAALERLATLDAGTGVANRRRFDDHLDQEHRRCQREHLPLALLLVDIDHFKAYNDTYGHLAGDACLRQVAGVLAAHSQRPGDLAARYGGEEFAVILAGLDGAAAAAHGERLRQAVAALAIPHAGSAVADWLTISVGAAALIPDVGDQPRTLIARADAALYRAKETRDRVVLAPTDAA